MDYDEYRRDARKYLTGGVSSSFRINPFNGKPMYLQRADGPFIFSIDGRQYIDFFMGHGACPLGHNRLEIRKAVNDILDAGFFAQFDHPITLELAKKITTHVPCAEQVRYVNSGSEGTLMAMRLARGYTGRSRIVRIDGHFHGGHDYALPNNLIAYIDRDNPGNRASKIGRLTAGIPEIIRESLYIIPWNNAEVFDQLAREKGSEIAAIIMNPIDFNNGCFGSSSEYMEDIRNICDQHGIVFIIDEVLSGFRTGLSCGQGYYNVVPDLTILGKALTNGVPLAAVAGKEKVMAKIMDPVDPVIAGGTFSGNLIGCAAGVAALTIMEQPGFFGTWLSRVSRFMETLQDIFDQNGVVAHVQNIGCNFYIYFGTRDPVTSFKDYVKLDPDLAKKFFCLCIENGLYFHTDFTVSVMHDDAVLEKAADVINKVSQQLAHG